MPEDNTQNILETISTSLAALVAIGLFMLVLLALSILAGRPDCPYINERGDRLTTYERRSEGIYVNCIYTAEGEDGL